MKKRLLSVISGTILLLSTQFVSAADHTVNVCKLQMIVTGWAYLSPCANWTSKAGNNGDWIQWDANTMGGQQMYKSALAAKITGTPIKVRITADTAWQYDVTSMIRILD